MGLKSLARVQVFELWSRDNTLSRAGRISTLPKNTSTEKIGDCFFCIVTNLVAEFVQRHQNFSARSMPTAIFFHSDSTSGNTNSSNNCAHDTQTMGLWLGTSFIGNFVAGWLGSFWSSMDKMSFFIMLAVVATSAGGVIWSFFNRPLKSILQG